MKKTLLLLFMILFSNISLAATETFDLYINNSFEFEDKNISLVNVDFENDKAVLCMNNEKFILDIDNDKTFNQVTFDLRKVDQRNIELKVGYKCEGDCICDESCSNDKCFPQPKPTTISTNTTITNNTTETNTVTPPQNNQEQNTPIDSTKSNKINLSNTQLVGVILLVVVALLGISYLIFKKSKV